MSVYKYRTFEDAERALWNFNPDEAYFKRVPDLWAFADQLNSIVRPNGIFKFRSIEEANKHRDELECEKCSRKCLHNKARVDWIKQGTNVEIILVKWQ